MPLYRLLVTKEEDGRNDPDPLTVQHELETKLLLDIPVSDDLSDLPFETRIWALPISIQINMLNLFDKHKYGNPVDKVLSVYIQLKTENVWSENLIVRNVDLRNERRNQTTLVWIRRNDGWDAYDFVDMIRSSQRIAVLARKVGVEERDIVLDNVKLGLYVF